MIVSEIEIVYKRKAQKHTKVVTTLQCYKVFKSVYDLNRVEHKEFFYCMYLNNAAQVLGVLLISEGGINACLCDLKIILQGALKLNATSIIVSHNHPSGKPKPSKTDLETTRRIKEAAELLSIHLLDHIIFCRKSFYSFSTKKVINVQ